MPLREFIARLIGTPAGKGGPLEAELRRLQETGDNARRNRQTREALEAYEEGLRKAQAQTHQHAQEIFLGQIGALHAEEGHFEEASRAFDEAYALASHSGEMFRKARAVLNLGAFYLKRGDLQKAQSYLEEALNLARKANDLITVGLALGNLADVYLKQSNPTYALRLLKEAAPQVMQNPSGAIYLLGRMGQAHLGVGEYDRGRKFLLQAMRLAEQNNQTELQLLWAILLADQAFKDGNLSEALRLYQEAETLSKTVVNIPTEYDLARVQANQATALQRLGKPHEALDTVNRALEGAQRQGNAAVEAIAYATLGGIRQALGQTAEAIEAYNNAIAIYSGDKAHSDAEHINVLVALGALYQDKGQIEKALEIFNQALEIAGDEDRVGRAQTLRRIGTVLQKQGNTQAALEKWTEALGLFELAGEHAQAARLLCDTGALRRATSGLNAALPDYERATVLLNHVRETNTRGVVLSNVANLYTDLGEVETARSFYEESIELARQIGNRRAESLRLGNFAWFHIMTGKAREAIPLLEASLAISKELNDALFIPVQTNNLAQAYHELKDYPGAEQLYRSAIAASEHMEPRWGAMFRSNLGRTLLAQGRTEEGIALLEESLPISRAAKDQETISRTLARLGEAYLRQARIEDADKAAREAEGLARKLGYRKGHADALVVRAGVAQAQNDSDSNVAFLKEAYRLFMILHDPLAADLARLLGEPAR